MECLQPRYREESQKILKANLSKKRSFRKDEMEVADVDCVGTPHKSECEKSREGCKNERKASQLSFAKKRYGQQKRGMI